MASFTDVKKAVSASAKYKERSHNTHNETHKLELELIIKRATETPGDANFPRVVLIGDSMLERFKTTGLKVQAKVTSRMDTVNVGVGGDKIENVLYRLDLGLWKLLKPLQAWLWIVHIGTNNAREKGPLKPAELENYRLLLQAILGISPAYAKIVVVAIFKRKDIKDEHIEASNGSIKRILADMNNDLGEERIEFLAQPNVLGKEYLEDHVHLNKEGYRIWDGVLDLAIDRVLEQIKEAPDQIAAMESPAVDVGADDGRVEVAESREKNIRALQKKLKAINDLKTRKAAREELESNQLKKIDSEEGVTKELDSMLGGEEVIS